MRKPILFFLGIIFLYSCNVSEKKAENLPTNLEGHWVNKEYLEALRNNHSPKKIIDNYTFYATELLIDNKKGDSIGVFNGQIEFSFLPFKRNGDTLRLKLNKSPQTDIIYSATEKTLSFTDKELNRIFTFIKADSNLIDKSYVPSVAFPTLINKHTLEGFWQLYEHNSTQKLVEFDKFGKIKGWEKYDSYSVCVNGDCMANQDGDVLFLGKNLAADMFGFSTKQDTIVIHQLITLTDPDEKPIYKHGQPMGLMIRKKN